MRVSSYIIAAPLEGQPFHVMAHGYTGALDKISSSIGEQLLSLRGKNIDSKSEVLGLDSITKENLMRRGYLTELSEQEEKEILISVAKSLHILDLNYTPTSFMIVPAYLCNLRCPYCFQSHDLHEGKGKYNRIMSRDMVDSAFSVMRQLSAPGSIARLLSVNEVSANQNNIPLKTISPEGPRIGLFGGEPLMRETRPIVEYILSSARSMGGSLSAVTNGVELDIFEDLLGPDSIAELQITIDGLPDYHDRRRTGGRFSNTFERICANIDIALSHNVNCSVRINVDRNNHDSIPELRNFFSDRGWLKNTHFSSYASAVHDAGVVSADSRLIDGVRLDPKPYHPATLTPGDLYRITSSLERQENMSTIESYERFARSFLESALDGAGYPFRRTAHCSSESGLLIFDPFGDMYTCWEEVGDTSRRVGKYENHSFTIDETVMRTWLSRFPGGIEECSRCPYALIHTSGCAKHALASSGTLFASACESFQSYFPKSLANLYGQVERRVLDQPTNTNKPTTE